MPPNNEQKAIAVLSLKLPARRSSFGNGEGLGPPGTNLVNSAEREELANRVAAESEERGGVPAPGVAPQPFQINRANQPQPGNFPAPGNPFAQLQTVLSNIGGRPGGGAVVSGGGGGVRTQTRVPNVSKTGLQGNRPAPNFGQTGGEGITDILGKASGGPPSSQLTGPVSQPLDFGAFNILGGAVGAPNPFAQLNNLLQTPRQPLSIEE
jgi:hypothetical protein